MSAETKTDLTGVARIVLDNLWTFVSGSRDLSELSDEDGTWLSKIADLVDARNSQSLIFSADAAAGEGAGGAGIDVLSPDSLRQSQQSKAVLEKLYYCLKAMVAAQELGGEPAGTAAANHVAIHNREIADKMCASYTAESFDALFALCKSKGVFALKVNEQNGLITTAEAEENWDMSGRQWVTDTVRCGDIERSVNPRAWSAALLTLCEFYHQDEEMLAIRNSIADPEYYRLGGLLDGVAHIFIPHTLKRDTTWFNNKRLESHGLALKAICDTVIAGASGKEKWGFSADQLQKHGDIIAQTIVCLASYLKSINTDKNGKFDFAAPSAGPWEEIPFPEGLTWDSEAIRSGFESLRVLLFANSLDKIDAVQHLRITISSHEFGDWLTGPQTIDHLLKQARGKIIDRLFGQVLPVESPHRPLDCSLGFIATSTITFDDNLISDVLMHYQLLKVLEEKLVRSHGIIRYAPFSLTMEDGSKEPVFDSYLADNYWLMPELRALINGIAPDTSNHRHFGSSDCSSHEDYLARVKMARPGTEAQWCFVSVLAEAYCLQVQKLQTLKEQIGSQAAKNAGNGKQTRAAGDSSAEVEKLIAFGMEKATEFINRSYARITPADATKANGRQCPSWAIPEAFEFVSPAGPHCRTHLAVLAGANTPLAWGQASLYRASELFSEILSRAGHAV